MGHYLPNLSSEWETTGLDGGNPSNAFETYLAETSPESLVLQLGHLCLLLERPQCVLRAESGKGNLIYLPFSWPPFPHFCRMGLLSQHRECVLPLCQALCARSEPWEAALCPEILGGPRSVA